MRMRDRQHQRAVRRRREFGRRIGRGDHRDVGGGELGELVPPRIDPPHREGQRRRRERQRAADVAGAEQIDRRPCLAERLAPGARSRGVLVEPPHDAAVFGELRPRNERPGALGRGQRLQFGEVAPIEGLDPPDDPPAAALAELGPSATERRRAGPRPAASAARAASSASNSSSPPPIVPKKPPLGRTTIRAPASRGADPAVSASVIRPANLRLGSLR